MVLMRPRRSVIAAAEHFAGADPAIAAAAGAPRVVLMPERPRLEATCRITWDGLSGLLWPFAW